MLPSRKISIVFAGVFLIGAVVGGLIMKDYTDTRLSQFLNRTSDPDSMATRINQKYTHDYQMSPEEQKRIAPLVKGMAQELYQERRLFGTNILTTLDVYHQKIREQMTPEQREAYDKVNDDRKKRLTGLLLSDPTPAGSDQK